MAARSIPQTLIAQTDLRSCTDAAAVFDLFRKLRYPVEPQPIAIPIEHGELPESLRDGIAARYPVAQLGSTRPGDPSLDITLFVLSDTDHKSALVRGIAANWTRRYPGQHLFVFTTQSASATGDFDQLTFVNTERLGEGAQVRVKLRKLIVERSHPTRHDADTLNRIALAASTEPATAAHKAQVDAFNVERMTDQFYKGYSQLFKNAVERIKANNPGIADFYDPSKLHAFAQRLFGRVMFLYFLQKKRSLDNNLNFIAQHYDDAIRYNENFYQSVLEPLFFDTLNQPRQDARSPKFGRVPYLNGGLFAQDDLDHRGEVYLDNDLFDTRGEGGILYFLNNHNFTIEEDTPLEVEVALDPEMLGKVFENLLEAEERGKSGTFYTPRPVVAFMCREALAAYLTRETGLTSDHLGWLLDEAETGEPARDDAGNPRLTYHNVSFALHQRIERALESIRVLDPAVGSGAFPLGMLALLVGVRRALYRIRENTISPHARIIEDWKRTFIRDCLYGIDIKLEAIEIARLRLWLSLVVDADPFDMEPLPNLDYKLMAGDSLIETFEGIEIYPTRPKDLQLSLLGREETHELIDGLHTLQDEYFQPDGKISRDQLKRQIQDTEVAIVEVTLKERESNEKLQLDRLTKQFAHLKTVPPTQQVALDNLQRSIALTQQAKADLRAGKPLPFFLYRLHFASVFEQKDGFDIVIANPPYVRHEKIAPATLATLKNAYPDVAHGMADLYVYFYARALQLLHEGGTLCFISSNKFFRAGYGKGLRETLNIQTNARIVLDFGDFPVFDAAAYPCIVIAGKGTPAPNHWYRAHTASGDIELDRLALILEEEGVSRSQADGVLPSQGTEESTALAFKLMRTGKPLGQLVNNRIYYGIKTGRNEAFVIDDETRTNLLSSDPRSAEVIKPFLMGRDVGRYHASRSGTYVLYIGWHTDISRYPAVEAHLRRFRDRLEARPECKQGRFPWYALSRYAADYYQEFSNTKIIYPDIAVRPEFAWDDTGAYLGNTNYFIPTSARYLCALLNSMLIGFVYATLTPQIRGGYYRFFDQYMERLPIVEPSPADQQRLSNLVDKLQALAGKGPEAEAYEREVDDIVYRTYSLAPDEIKIIEDWHEERRVLLGAGKRGQAAVETNDGAEDQETGQ